jgi:hypothetical protein
MALVPYYDVSDLHFRVHKNLLFFLLYDVLSSVKPFIFTLLLDPGTGLILLINIWFLEISTFEENSRENNLNISNLFTVRFRFFKIFKNQLHNNKS